MADTQVVFDIIARTKGELELRKLGLEVQLLQRKLKKLNLAQASSGKSAEAAASRLDKLRESSLLADVGLSGMQTAALALGPALLPALGGGVLAAGGLATSLVSAGAAAGVFGVVMKAGVKQVQDAVKANRDMPGPLGRTTDAYRRMTDAWTAFQKTNSKATFGLLTRGFTAVAAVIPKLQPLFDVASAAAGRFFAQFERAVSNGTVDRVVGQLAVQAGPALSSLSTIAVNAAKGLGGLFRAFAPFGNQVLAWVAGLSSKWAAWASQLSTSAGFGAFIAYVQANGPKVVSTLAEFGRAAVNLVVGLAPLAPTSLSVANAAARMLAAMPPQVITAISGALGSLAVALRVTASGFGAVKAVAGVVDQVRGVSGVLKAASVQAGLFASGWRDLRAAESAFSGVAGTLAGRLRVLTSGMVGLAVAEDGTTASTRTLGVALTTVSKVVAVVGTAGAVAGTFMKIKDAADQGHAAIRRNTSAMQDAIPVFARTGQASGELARALEVVTRSKKELQNGTWTGPKGEIATFEALDKALANSAKSGHAVDAAITFNKISQGALASGRSLEDVSKAFPKYTAAAAKVPVSAAVMQAAMERNAAVMRGEIVTVDQLISSLHRLNDTNLTAASAQIDFLNQTANVTTALKNNHRELSLNTQAGREDRSAIISAAQSAIAYAEASRSQGASLGQVNSILATSRERLISSAVAAGTSRAAARLLVDQYLKIPTARATSITAPGAHETFNMLAGIRQNVFSIPTSRTVRITVTTHYNAPTGTSVHGIVGATGGLYTGRKFQRYDVGGMVRGPGTGTSDSIFAPWLSNGEFVVTAAATRRNLGLLEAINSGRTAASRAHSPTLAGVGTPGRGGAGGSAVHVHFHGPVGSPQQLEDWLARASDNLRRKGRL